MGNQASMSPVRVTIWNEFHHERHDQAARAIYPDGIHAAIGAGLEGELGPAISCRYALLDEPENGLSQEVLDATDVLTWWDHGVREKVSDEVAARVADRVLRGMGLIVLHSAHFSKVFRRLMGTSCRLRWRGEQDRELVWTVNPGHPIADGVEVPIVIGPHEMYGEFFDIPTPDELVFISSFSGGEVFRSGCCFYRGRGKIFYFSPGDQEYPIYYHPQVVKVLANAVRWAAPTQPILPGDYAPEFCPAGWFETPEGRKEHAA